MTDSSSPKKSYYLETYGCQMNFADSEVVHAILSGKGMEPVETAEGADLILINTCAIRDNAEARVWERLKHFRHLKRKNKSLTVGLLGCMAERLKEKVLDREKLVDMVVGPDAYRDIPNLLNQVEDGRKAMNVILSYEETYADITPVKTFTNGVTAFVSIMRGCDNMCAFCVVPFTRGRERSRPIQSVLDEIKGLSDQGFKEITLLGQNVNSYNDNGTRFAELMYQAGRVNPEIRIRFSTSHPKDFPDELLWVIREQPNICNYIHIPVQSGNNDVLRRMRRPYTREQYLALIERMRQIIPGVSFSTDIITGFCGETEEEHANTVSLMETVKYDLAYMFAYSERDRTVAQRKFKDDVPEETKKRRLSEIIEIQHRYSKENNLAEIGNRHLVLVEGSSKKSKQEFYGRTDTNKAVVFEAGDYRPGQFVEVEITGANSATLRGNPVRECSISSFYQSLIQS